MRTAVRILCNFLRLSRCKPRARQRMRSQSRETTDCTNTAGGGLWSRNPDECCNLRKVEPLRRKLTDLSAWITSIRRDQTSDRAGARKIEWDEKFGLVKVNPLADWSSAQVWRYIREHDVPYN